MLMNFFLKCISKQEQNDSLSLLEKNSLLDEIESELTLKKRIIQSVLCFYPSDLAAN
jgi:hypothetical protein